MAIVREGGSSKPPEPPPLATPMTLEHRLRVWMLGLGSFAPVSTFLQAVNLANYTSYTPACKHSLTADGTLLKSVTILHFLYCTF